MRAGRVGRAQYDLAGAGVDQEADRRAVDLGHHEKGAPVAATDHHLMRRTADREGGEEGGPQLVAGADDISTFCVTDDQNNDNPDP